MNTWERLETLEDAYLPDIWRNPPEAALQAGHGGGDYFEVLDFINSIVDGTPCPIGIHESMDMTFPDLSVKSPSVTLVHGWMCRIPEHGNRE